MKRYVLSVFGLVLGLAVHTSVLAQTVSLGKTATLRAKTTNAQIYEWTFPDGVVINGEVVQYTFTDPGPQQVQLKVTDFEGNTNEITRTILVANDSRPTAIIELSVNGNTIAGNNAEMKLGDTINLGSASFAVDKQAEDFTNTWTVNGRNYPESALGSVFNRIGSYTVILAVADPLNANQKDQTSIQLKVVNQAPEVARLEITPVGNSNEQFRVRAVAEDPDGEIASYKFEALDAGKPIVTQMVAVDNTVFDLSRFPGLRSYNFRVTVADDLFLTTTFTDSQVYEVDPVSNNSAPAVAMQVVPGNQAYVGEPFNFQVDATDDDNDALKYDWTFSDGARYSSRSFQRVFLEPGTYNVQVAVSDGLSSTIEEMDITILSREVTAATNNAPEATITGVLPNQTGSLNELFRFYLKAEDEDGDRLTYQWDFGNGAVSSTKNAAIVYDQSGTYDVTVTVSDGIESVTAETTITVEPGSREVYFESADERLASLQAEQAALQAAIAANGGEITPAQRAQLDALNSELKGLIRDASANGDTATLNQLAQVSTSLGDVAAQIRLADQPGLSAEDYIVELTEDQAAELEALQDAELLAAQMQDERLQIQDLNFENTQSSASLTLQTQADRQRAELATLESERIALREQLIVAQNNNNQAAQDQIQAQIDRRDAAITATGDMLEAQAERQRDELEALKNEREALQEALEAAEAANDEAQADSLQTLIDQRDDSIEEMDEIIRLQTERQVLELANLQSDREALAAQLVEAEANNDTLEAQRLQDLIDLRDESIAETGEMLEAQAERQRVERQTLEDERDDLLEALVEAEANNDTEAEARLQALITDRTEGIDRITEDLLLQDARQARERADIEAERNDLLRDLATAEANRDSEAQVRLQALIDNRTEEIRASQAMQLAQADRQAQQRADIQTERNLLLADLERAELANDTEAENRLNALIQSREEAIVRFDSAKISQAERQAQELASLETERALLTEDLKAAEAAGDAEAQAQIQAQIDRRDVAITESQTLLLDQQAQYDSELEAMLADWDALRDAEAAALASNDLQQAANLQKLMDQREAAIASNALEVLEYQEILAEQQATLALQRDQLKADLETAEARSDTRAMAQLQAQLDLREQAILANAEAILAHQDTVANQQSVLQDRRTELRAALDDANAIRDFEQAARLETQIQTISQVMEAANIEHLNQQAVLAEQQALLKSQRDQLRMDLEAAQESADATAAQQLASQLAEQERVISLTQAAVLQYQNDLVSQQEILEAERQRLKGEAETAQVQADAVAAAVVENQLLNVTQVMSEYNAAANAHRESLAQQKADLEAERDRLTEASKAAMQNADMARVQRINVQVQQIESSILSTQQALSESQANAAASREALEAERQALLLALKEADLAGDEKAKARIKQQLAQIELLKSSLDRMPKDDFVAEQRARFDAKKAANDVLLTEIQTIQSQGGNLNQLATALENKADITDANSEAFLGTAALIEQQDKTNRLAFLDEQVASLEAQSENPTPLPSLGVSRQNSDTLDDRLNRLETQTQRAAIEARERENAAVEIATIQQQEKLSQLQRLESSLQAESDAARKAVIQTRIDALTAEIAQLEAIKNPGSVLTDEEIDDRVDTLIAELDTLTETVTGEQREFMEARLATVEAEISLASDPTVRAALEAEKKQLEANLGRTEILTDYETQLKARQAEINLRLATNLSTTAKLSEESNLEAIERKLDNFAQLQAKQLEINSIDTDEASEAVSADQFLQNQKAALELELREIKASISRAADPVEKRALEQREAEIVEQLESIPDASSDQFDIEDLRLSEVADYLTHYKNRQTEAFELSGDGKDIIDQLADQIALINRLNNFGYTPQTRLSVIMQDLEARESDLLVDFREALTDEAAEEIKVRLVVMAEAIEQIKGLSEYNISPSDSVLRALEKLDQSVAAASGVYLASTNEIERRLTLQTLESLRISQRWLGRFYKAEEHNMTLAELEARLKSDIEAKSTPQLVNDLVVLQSIKANLNKALAAQLETDFENFKTNLQKQAKQINNADEKIVVEQRIKALEAVSLDSEVTLDEVRFYEALMADMNIRVKSNLFLYADVPLTEYPQPLLFEWDLGDGQTRYGQNVNHEYLSPGFYRVVLTMNDGVTSEQDLFTIRVTE